VEAGCGAGAGAVAVALHTTRPTPLLASCRPARAPARRAQPTRPAPSKAAQHNQYGADCLLKAGRWQLLADEDLTSLVVKSTHLLRMIFEWAM